MSCDLLETESAGPHYQGDVCDILHDGWDLMIAHPPCTHLAVSGSRWFDGKRKEQAESLEFVRLLMGAPIPMIAIENPVSIISSHIRKPDQVIQPWQFGHEAAKTTCLWLKSLPRLRPTRIVGRGERHVTKSGKSLPKWYNLPPSKDRWKIRSATFSGIAQAMAEQWGNLEEFRLTS
jgi:site-specific DNA-cytosine methylase